MDSKMATAELTVDGIGEVKLFRRRGLKHLRITIGRSGDVRLSVPWYVPKSAALVYLVSKKDWIAKHKKTKIVSWHNNQALTDKYTLTINESDGQKVTSKLYGGTLAIAVPKTRINKQEIIRKHVRKFLTVESEKNLIPMANKIASENGYKIKSIRIKNLKARWGSCDSKRNITLSSTLITLNQDMIHYVICHELAHTKHLNHSKAFWAEVEELVPDYKSIKKRLNKAPVLP